MTILGCPLWDPPDSTAKCTVGHPGTIQGCCMWDTLDYMSWDKAKCMVGRPGTVLGCRIYSRTSQVGVPHL